MSDFTPEVILCNAACSDKSLSWRHCLPCYRRSLRLVSPRFDGGIAPVAQLDRAPDYESGGWEFDSLRARHRNQGRSAVKEILGIGAGNCPLATGKSPIETRRAVAERIEEPHGKSLHNLGDSDQEIEATKERRRHRCSRFGLQASYSGDQEHTRLC